MTLPEFGCSVPKDPVQYADNDSDPSSVWETHNNGGER